MQLDEQTLSTLVVALAVAVVVLALWVAWLQRSDALLRRRLRRLIGDAEGAGLDELLDRQFRRLDSVAERVEALNKLHHELEALSQRSIQKVGVIRFNPFADTGGDQSFAMALLDAEGNGVVVSSLHSGPTRASSPSRCRADVRGMRSPTRSRTPSASRSRPLGRDDRDLAQRRACSCHR